MKKPQWWYSSKQLDNALDVFLNVHPTKGKFRYNITLKSSHTDFQLDFCIKINASFDPIFHKDFEIPT